MGKRTGVMGLQNLTIICGLVLNIGWLGQIIVGVVLLLGWGTYVLKTELGELERRMGSC